MLVRERILGPAHPDTSYYIRYRGAVYADMGHFERCITLWMYALDMQQKMLEPLSPMTQSSLLSFAELFSFMMSEGRARNQQQHGGGGGVAPVAAPANVPNININNDDDNSGYNNRNNNNDNERQQPLSGRPQQPPVNFCDIMTVFEKAVREVETGQASMRAKAKAAAANPAAATQQARGSADRDLTYFNRTLIIILHLVCLLTRLLPHLSEQERHRVKRAVFLFLKLDPRGRNGATPLHLACAKDSSSVGRYPICQVFIVTR